MDMFKNSCSLLVLLAGTHTNVMSTTVDIFCKI